MSEPSAADRMGDQSGGRVAVVTGASRGLGAGLAATFAASGLHLGLCARHRPDFTGPSRPALAADHVAALQGAVRRAVDVTDRAALERFAAEVVERFGRIDLWVNNAGLLGPLGPLADADPAEVADTVDVNVTGVLHGSAVFAAHVRGREGTGVLVNVSSGAATTPYVGWAVYCATKAAVEQLTRVVALEEAPHGLRAYALAPGLVDTDMQTRLRAADEESFPPATRFRAAAATHRYNSPAWVGGYVLDLAFGTRPPAEVTLRVPDQASARAGGAAP